MTSLIIFLLVGGGCLATAAWAVWQDPASRQTLHRYLGAKRSLALEGANRNAHTTVVERAQRDETRCPHS